MRASLIAMGSFQPKNPWRLSPTRKANVRKRMKEVDSVLHRLRISGVSFKALENTPVPSMNNTKAKYMYYTYDAKSHLHCKSIQKVPHFTKTALSRTGFANIW